MSKRQREDDGDEEDTGAGIGGGGGEQQVKRKRTAGGNFHQKADFEEDGERTENVGSKRRARLSVMQAGRLEDNDAGDHDIDEDDDRGARLQQLDYEEEGAEFDEEGAPIEPFNLRNERDEGYFDQQGNYYTHREEGEERDAFVDQLDEQFNDDKGKGVKKPTFKKPVAAQVKPLEPIDTEALKRELIGMLKPRETIFKAMGRLKGSKAEVNRLTDIGSMFMADGENNIYNFTVEEIKLSLGKKGPISATLQTGGGAGAAAAAEEEDEFHVGTVQLNDDGVEMPWEYKWVETGEKQGPFTTAMMLGWKDYFSQNPIMVRRVDGTMGWTPYQEVNFG